MQLNKWHEFATRDVEKGMWRVIVYCLVKTTKCEWVGETYFHSKINTSQVKDIWERRWKDLFAEAKVETAKRQLNVDISIARSL